MTSSFCFSCCGCKKSCHPLHMSPPSRKWQNCFWQRNETPPVLSKAVAPCLFRHAGWIVKWILALKDAQKCLKQFQEQSHPAIGSSVLLKIKNVHFLLVSSGFRCELLKICIAQTSLASAVPGVVCESHSKIQPLPEISYNIKDQS